MSFLNDVNGKKSSKRIAGYVTLIFAMVLTGFKYPLEVLILCYTVSLAFWGLTFSEYKGRVQKLLKHNKVLKKEVIKFGGNPDPKDDDDDITPG